MDGRERLVWAFPFALSLGWILAFIAAGFGLQFLPVGVVFRRARPRGRIFGKAARPMWHYISNYAPAGTRSKNRARGDEQDYETGHERQITKE